MNPSPIPAAIRGPLVTPVRTNPDEVTPGTTVQPQGSPQQNINPGAGSYNANTTTTVYTVPAGKTLVITSCLVSAATQTNQQFVSLLQGATVLGTLSLGAANTSDDMCVNGPITVDAGTNLKVQIGSGTPAVAVKISGYLVDPATYPAPTVSPIGPTPALG